MSEIHASISALVVAGDGYQPVVDEALKELVMQRSPSGKIKKFAIDHGMRTLRDDGWRKVLAGRTTIDEVLRVTKANVVQTNQ